MQQSYSVEHSLGLVGDLAQGSDGGHTIFPKRNNSGADLPFGRALAHDAGSGTSEFAVKLPSALADKIVGVSVRSAARAVGPNGTAGTDGVRDDGMLDCLSKGQAYVAPEQAVTPGDAVYVRFGAGSDPAGADAPGAFRKDADTVDAWAKNTGYTAGDRVASSGVVLECTNAGTSDADVEASTASGPVGTTSGIVDGGCVWDYVSVWVKKTAYVKGAYCRNDTDRIYKCTAAGTSEDADNAGPKGTGTGITDDGATWDYVGTLTPWVQDHAYALEDVVSNNSGKGYVCTDAGTSEADVAEHTAVAPTVAGVDGSVTWKVAGACDSGTRASAAQIVAVWRSSTAAGAVAVVELNLP